MIQPTYHPKRLPSPKYIIKPLAERLDQIVNYRIRQFVRAELECTCDGFEDCPACEDALECQCNPDPNREGTACLACRAGIHVRGNQ